MQKKDKWNLDRCQGIWCKTTRMKLIPWDTSRRWVRQITSLSVTVRSMSIFIHHSSKSFVFEFDWELLGTLTWDVKDCSVQNVNDTWYHKERQLYLGLSVDNCLLVRIRRSHCFTLRLLVEAFAISLRTDSTESNSRISYPYTIFAIKVMWLSHTASHEFKDTKHQQLNSNLYYFLVLKRMGSAKTNLLHNMWNNWVLQSTKWYTVCSIFKCHTSFAGVILLSADNRITLRLLHFGLKTPHLWQSYLCCG